MIKIENVMVTGWEPAIRGMRNPMNSWDKSDTLFYDYYDDSMDDIVYHTISGKNLLKRMDAWDNDISWTELGLKIGPNDMKLMKTLVAGGPVHAKFRRMIVVYVDITAPLYWWHDMDIYKVGIVKNSCSTKHKIHAKAFEENDFSTDHTGSAHGMFLNVMDILNIARSRFLATKDKAHWYAMQSILPWCYNQRATMMFNYEVLANIYHSRKDHKLDEFREFCEWIETLPYAKELIIGGE
jgi:hypothetical protein